MYALDYRLGLVIDLSVAGLALVNVAIIVTFTGSITAGDVGIIMDKFRYIVGCHFPHQTPCNTVAPKSQPTQEHVIPRSWPYCGKITQKNVVSDSHSTVEGTSASDHALTGITVKVSPGQKIAVCGQTGSGKSSLLLSLLRMIDLSEGTILIDGLDLSSISRDLIRSRIITIPQDLFSIPGDFIRRNLDVEEIAADKKIVAILKIVQLWSNLESGARDAGLLPTFYLDLPMKSLTLSEGQLQLFSLACALFIRLSRGKFVIFEESTTSTDTQTSGIVQQVIHEEFRGYTIKVVAQQIKTIVASDYIVVIDKEWIVESGSLNVLQHNEGMLKFLLDSTVL
ncbi:hypothetical protein PENCOP_c007G00723 [Penicillium coprophilum]|uniref:ABC transporter domain-containing protein n=1 Tax=Penicillium coprophilum TaxID=36646 RepID=A0A1V6UKT3_9EURO|nr:hypothetical protein PENCOP_c007G00723 [Penicillium coprophilum]